MKTARQYQSEIATWANHNFTYIDKVGYGMIEELGEYCHAILKNRQGVRHVLKGGRIQTEVPNLPQPMVARAKQIALEEELQDCIADGMIFTLHWAEANETFISFEETRRYCDSVQDENELLAITFLLSELAMAIKLSALTYEEGFTDYRVPAQRVFNRFAMLAKSRGWNWESLLEKTWAQVSKRDWIKFPFDGKTK